MTTPTLTEILTTTLTALERSRDEHVTWRPADRGHFVLVLTGTDTPWIRVGMGTYRTAPAYRMADVTRWEKTWGEIQAATDERFTLISADDWHAQRIATLEDTIEAVKAQAAKLAA